MSVEPVPATPVLDREPQSPLPVVDDAGTPAPPAERPVTSAHLDHHAPHQHARTCYWDFRVAAWVCPCP